MKHISVMIKPASSLCNLKCKYCFYEDESGIRENRSYGLMDEKTMKAVITNVLSALTGNDEVTFAFQGGEPTLAGLTFFKNFIEYVNIEKSRNVKVSYVIQTNATLLNDEWCEFFKENGFLVGVSLDLHKGSHDLVRASADGNGSFEMVLEKVRLLEKHGAEFNILCTLTNEIAKYPRKVWEFIVKNDLKFVQFTPCLGSLSDGDREKKENGDNYALSPERFAAFYKDITDRWYIDFKNGDVRSIKLIHDITNLVLFNKRAACGIDGKCCPQIIVEADGSAFPCDFYCLDEYLIGNLANDDVLTLYERSAASKTKDGKPLPDLCSSCKYISICNGGCKRMRENICFNSDSEGSCGYRDLLDHLLPKIYSLRGM